MQGMCSSISLLPILNLTAKMSRIGEYFHYVIRMSLCALIVTCKEMYLSVTSSMNRIQTCTTNLPLDVHHIHLMHHTLRLVHS